MWCCDQSGTSFSSILTLSFDNCTQQSAYMFPCCLLYNWSANPLLTSFGEDHLEKKLYLVFSPWSSGMVSAGVGIVVKGLLAVFREQPCPYTKSAAVWGGISPGRCDTTPEIQCDSWVSTAECRSVDFCQILLLLMPRVPVNLAISWFWPHFSEWVDRDIHDNDLHCPVVNVGSVVDNWYLLLP